MLQDFIQAFIAHGGAMVFIAAYYHPIETTLACFAFVGLAVWKA